MFLTHFSIKVVPSLTSLLFIIIPTSAPLLHHSLLCYFKSIAGISALKLTAQVDWSHSYVSHCMCPVLSLSVWVYCRLLSLMPLRQNTFSSTKDEIKVSFCCLFFWLLIMVCRQFLSAEKSERSVMKQWPALVEGPAEKTEKKRKKRRRRSPAVASGIPSLFRSVGHHLFSFFLFDSYLLLFSFSIHFSCSPFLYFSILPAVIIISSSDSFCCLRSSFALHDASKGAPLVLGLHAFCCYEEEILWMQIFSFFFSLSESLPKLGQCVV